MCSRHVVGNSAETSGESHYGLSRRIDGARWPNSLISGLQNMSTTLYAAVRGCRWLLVIPDLHAGHFGIRHGNKPRNFRFSTPRRPRQPGRRDSIRCACALLAYFLEAGPGGNLASGYTLCPRKMGAESTGQIGREKFRPGLTSGVTVAALMGPPPCPCLPPTPPSN